MQTEAPSLEEGRIIVEVQRRALSILFYFCLYGKMPMIAMGVILWVLTMGRINPLGLV